MIKGRRILRKHRLSLLAALLLTGVWAIERWGLGSIPAPWSLMGTAKDCRLDTLLDGDSLRLVCGDEPLEVRLHCIDAPERDQGPWGRRSRAALRAMVTHRLELIPIERDRFGRTVGQVYTRGPERRLLNLEQVKRGNAAVYDRYCKDPRFLRAEREAREAGLGIWSRPGDHQTPWAFRLRQQPGSR